MSDYELKQRLGRIERLLKAVLERLPGDPPQLADLTADLADSEAALRSAIDSAAPFTHPPVSLIPPLFGERPMSLELDNLKAQVARNTDVEASAATLLGGLKKLLDDAIASGDPAALTKLSSDLGASQTALAKAVTDNTPAPPAPPPAAAARKQP